MKNLENYKIEIFELFKLFLERSKSDDTNAIEDEMIRDLRLNELNISERDLEIIAKLYLKFESDENSIEDIINLLKD